MCPFIASIYRNFYSARESHAASSSSSSSSFLNMLKAAYTGAHFFSVRILFARSVCMHACMCCDVLCAASSGPAHRLGHRRGSLQPGLLRRHTLLRLRPPQPILVCRSAPSCFSEAEVEGLLCLLVCVTRPRLFLRALRAAMSGDEVRFSCECQYNPPPPPRSTQDGCRDRVPFARSR